ncbi:MAG: cytochrome ubiquinol oxidase subunit I, partial [Acidobacteria bacterium]|nr:cytochrome ubiquinol oxidase subunit I [Acidobacteriota bacterium]
MTDYNIYPPVNNFLFSPLTIAIVGFLHSVVSHLAIGGGILLYIEERRCSKEGDSILLNFIKSVSEKFLYIVVVFGSVSGLAVWLIIGMISPFSTSLLVNRFLWILAIEWVFFFLAIFLLLIYFDTWEKVSDKIHLQIIRNYSISAFLTLFFINGILTFQLTPTKVRETFNLFKAFFNRTFFPSLMSRSFMALMVASLFLLVFVSLKEESALRNSLAKRYFKILFYSFVLFLISLVFYRIQIPKGQIENFSKISYLK